MELTSGYWRARVSHWFGELWWQFGHLSLGLLVYAIPNMKHLELFIGLSAVPFMALWWLLPESPRWLLSKGKNQEAVKVIKLVCKWNKMPIENVEQWNIQDTESSVSKGTFKGEIHTKMARYRSKFSFFLQI